MSYQVTKTYGHETGLSCCFRQHKATHSHCSKIHGYALAFSFVFECDKLDDRNWCVDFGDLDGLKQSLRDCFDHTFAVANDDPAVDTFLELHTLGLARVLVLARVGCEAFAEFAWGLARIALRERGLLDRVRVVSCTVSEHGANSATYTHKGIDVHA